MSTYTSVLSRRAWVFSQNCLRVSAFFPQRHVCHSNEVRTEVRRGDLVRTESLPLPVGKQKSSMCNLRYQHALVAPRSERYTTETTHFLFRDHQRPGSLGLRDGVRRETSEDSGDPGRTNCGLRSTGHLSASKANPPVLGRGSVAFNPPPSLQLRHTHPTKHNPCPNASHQF